METEIFSERNILTQLVEEKIWWECISQKSSKHRSLFIESKAFKLFCQIENGVNNFKSPKLSS